ncbi:Coiled-coil domain-containing protein 158 [Heterocephalus glaber]|uniref:Coiled-coil domain-containing protein 158 n=1 Tax=Heterocephalus glaber TaxID=10181 RepID=G5ANV5_HETGA|nr:Coiled-coil domain-containing protein 158 [Heterocephalus glaber]
MRVSHSPTSIRRVTVRGTGVFLSGIDENGPYHNGANIGLFNNLTETEEAGPPRDLVEETGLSHSLVLGCKIPALWELEVQHLEALLKAMKSEHQGQMERQMAAIQGKNESLEKVSSLTVQLESTKEKLHKVVEELTAKKMTLESSERTVSDLRASLQEKEQAIEATNTEITSFAPAWT